jgi:small subunit ribosomal protein S6
MPLYELLVITKCLRTATAVSALVREAGIAKSVLSFSARHVLDNGGVVRNFQNLGTKQLPYRMKRHQEIFDHGSYYTMKFDSSPKVMQNLSHSLKLNENIIRHSIVNLGSKLGEISDYEPPERVKN